MGTKRTLQDFLRLRQELESELKEHGIELSKISGVLDQLELYVDDCANLEQLRNEQFHEAAYIIGVEVSAASNKNVDKISAFLRTFAYHVATSVLAMDTTSAPLEDIVDRIPDMRDERDE